VDGKYSGLSFFGIVGNVITLFEWKRINDLDFGGKFQYKAGEDKIPIQVMGYLEDIKRIWSPLPLYGLDSNDKKVFMYDTFLESVKKFLEAQQNTAFRYVQPETMVKANYLCLAAQNFGKKPSYYELKLSLGMHIEITLKPM
jgi:hypothetical protein